MKRFAVTYGPAENRIVWGEYKKSSSAISWFQILCSIPQFYEFPMIIDREEKNGFAIGNNHDN